MPRSRTLRRVLIGKRGRKAYYRWVVQVPSDVLVELGWAEGAAIVFNAEDGALVARLA